MANIWLVATVITKQHLREGKKFAHSHMANKQQSWDLNLHFSQTRGRVPIAKLPLWNKGSLKPWVINQNGQWEMQI